MSSCCTAPTPGPTPVSRDRRCRRRSATRHLSHTHSLSPRCCRRRRPAAITYDKSSGAPAGSLNSYLQDSEVEEIFVVGVGLDGIVAQSAANLRAAFGAAEVYVVEDACVALHPEAAAVRLRLPLPLLHVAAPPPPPWENPLHRPRRHR